MDFLNDYLRYNEGNEANILYHQWSAFSVIASAASRKIWVKQGYFIVPTNMYIGLIGPSGNRKTTARNEAYAMLYDALKDVISISGESMSKEAITQFLGKEEQQRQYRDPVTGDPVLYTPFSIFCTELSMFLAINPIAMGEFLTAIYDMQFYQVVTKNKGTDIIEKPFINMLCCDTPENITFRLKTRIMSAGFARRFLPIYEWSSGGPKPRPQMLPEYKEAYLRCKTHLQSLWRISGQMEWVDDAAAFFDAWYVKNFDRVDANPLMQAYYKSKADLVLKLATILACCSYKVELKLTRDLLFKAIVFLEQIEPNMRKLYSTFGENKLVIPGSRIVEVVSAMGGLIPKSQLKAKMWQDLQGRDFDEVLQHYLDSGDLYLGHQVSKTNPDIKIPVVFNDEYKDKQKISQTQK